MDDDAFVLVTGSMIMADYYYSFSVINYHRIYSFSFIIIEFVIIHYWLEETSLFTGDVLLIMLRCSLGRNVSLIFALSVM